nr:helical backbone metal receptor [Chitinophagaceae bacterium]
VGGTKNVDPEKVHSLQPDLIIASKEENVEEQVMALAGAYPVLLTDIAGYEDALEVIAAIGNLCNRPVQATDLVNAIQAAFDGLSVTVAGHDAPRVAYCIWREPWMFAGGDTFISSMLEKAGFSNLLAGQKRYPALTLDKLANLAPDLVFLSSEPFPFREQHLAEVQAACPGARVMLVDGECFSWYGSHMLQAPAYFATLHHQLRS